MKGLKRAARQLYERGRNQAFLDPRRDVRAARLVVGSGRSGTTWLQEIACRAGHLRPVFEPFHAVREPFFADVPFGRYIRPDSSDAELLERVDAVLSGRFRSPWQDHLTRPAVYRGRVVKDIRILLWAAWVARNFPAMPIAYVIRHPLAVASSARALEWRPEQLQLMTSQRELVADHLSEVVSSVRALTSEWQQAVAAWCIENLVALRTLPSTGAHLVVYEEAVTRSAALEEFLAHFGLSTDHLSGAAAHSKTTRPDSPRLAGGTGPTSWRSSIEPALAEEGMEVLRAFGFDALFHRDGFVDAARLRAQWAAHGGQG